MDTDLIRVFSAVVEAGSLNRAAEGLGTSQSTLSRQLQALEASVGGRLLERGASGVALTSLGRSFLGSMQPVLRNFERALEDARQLARGKSSVLRIGYLMSAVPDFINPSLAGLRAARPDVKLALSDLSPGEQVEALRRGDIDVGLVGHAGAFLSREFYARRLATLPVVVAMAQDHPLVGRATLRVADLRGQLFVGAHESDMPGHNRWVSRLCQAAGFRPRFVEDADSLLHVLAITVSEGAVALVPDYATKLLVPGVVCRPCRGRGASWDMYVAWQRGRLSEPLQSFLSFLPSAKAEPSPARADLSGGRLSAPSAGRRERGASG